MATTIQIRVDEDLKENQMLCLKIQGPILQQQSAFFKKALAVNGFPFEVRRGNTNPFDALTEQEILDKLEKSREHATQGLFKDATQVTGTMREKYGL